MIFTNCHKKTSLQTFISTYCFFTETTSNDQQISTITADFTKTFSCWMVPTHTIRLAIGCRRHKLLSKQYMSRASLPEPLNQRTLPRPPSAWWVGRDRSSFLSLLVSWRQLTDRETAAKGYLDECSHSGEDFV